MSIKKSIWNTKDNAEAYNAYARNFPMYKDTSRDLVTISQITSGMTVVDLAAGTGATTQAILDRTGADIHIIAVDQAEEMLKKVKEKFANQAVQVLTSEAENLDKVIHELVDAVICNSAFWQMKAQQVFKSVSNILKEGGIFAFNLPDSFFSYKDFKKQPINPSLYNFDDLISWGNEAGFTLVTQKIESYAKTAEEILAFNEIPVMKRNFQSEDERKKFVAKLQEESAFISSFSR